MFRRTCPKCRRTGMVRGERVIKAGDAVTEFTCNACEYVWQQPDEDADSGPPDRSNRRGPTDRE